MSKPPERRAFQFSIKSMLGVMVITALSLAVAKDVSPAALVLGVVGIPVQLALLCRWNGWSWRLGVLILLIIAMMVTPPDPYSMSVFASLTIGVYLLAMFVLRSRKS